MCSAISPALRVIATSLCGDSPAARRTRLDSSRIERLFSRRPRLPPPVHPEPLIGMPSGVVFNHACEPRCILPNIGRVITGARKLNGGLEAQAVPAGGRVPVDVP